MKKGKLTFEILILVKRGQFYFFKKCVLVPKEGKFFLGTTRRCEKKVIKVKFEKRVSEVLKNSEKLTFENSS